MSPMDPRPSRTLLEMTPPRELESATSRAQSCPDMSGYRYINMRVVSTGTSPVLQKRSSHSSIFNTGSLPSFPLRSPLSSTNSMVPLPIVMDLLAFQNG